MRLSRIQEGKFNRFTNAYQMTIPFSEKGASCTPIQLQEYWIVGEKVPDG